MVRVVAHERGHVEGGREPVHAVLEEVLEARVRVLRRAEAGELAHRPEPAAVHRGLRAARERVAAGVADVAQVVALRHARRVEDVGDRDPGVGLEARLAPRELARAPRRARPRSTTRARRRSARAPRARTSVAPRAPAQPESPCGSTTPSGRDPSQPWPFDLRARVRRISIRCAKEAQEARPGSPGRRGFPRRNAGARVPRLRSRFAEPTLGMNGPEPGARGAERRGAPLS